MIVTGPLVPSNEEVLYFFLGWSFQDIARQIPPEEGIEFQDEELIPRIRQQMGMCEILDMDYFVGGTWRTEHFWGGDFSDHPTPTQYAINREENLRTQLNANGMGRYHCGVVVQTYHTRKGLIVGSCYLIYGGGYSPPGEDMPEPVAA